MKVLITGGYGFIGSHIAERFYKEGYQVYIIDNLSSGDKQNVKIKHKFYQMNVEDKKCEEVFANNKFDVVVHLAAHIDAMASVEKPYDDAESNVLGLINILELSSKYHVEKFIFASSAAVYGNNDKISLEEEDECSPISPYGVSKFTGEEYCRLWKNMYGLNTICFRLSNVYGPRQSLKGESGVISIFMNKVFNNKKLFVYGNGEQTRDFIYVEDVVDAIYKSVEFSFSEVLNISVNEQYNINNLIEVIRKLNPSVEVEYCQPRKGEISHSRLLNDKAINELDWSPIYKLEQGIEKTYQWYENYYKEAWVKNNKEEFQEKSHQKGLINKLLPYKYVLPYIENILAFLVVLFLSNYTKNYGMEVVVDFKLLYIIVIGIIYGLRQVSIAVFLSCALFIWEISSTGHDFISLIYNVNTLIYFSLYIFIGTVLGYSIETQKFELDVKEDEKKEIKEKFDFLYDMYNESKLVRKDLQDQVISTEDSFGKIYKITSTLDTLEPDKVFAGAISVIEEIMKSKDICIFSVSKTQHYLRLISKSKDSKIDVPKSIKVSDFSQIENVIHKKSMFVNKELKESLPMMMSPITVNNKVVIIIAIYTMEFDTLSQYKQNLLKVVSNLITASLDRAYQYEQAIHDEKYIKGTIFHNSKYFPRLLQSKAKEKQENNTEFILLKICESNWLNGYLIKSIEKSIRELDYVGINEKNKLFILLSNTKPEEAKYVINRFNNMYIRTEIIKEEEYYETDFIGSTFSA